MACNKLILPKFEIFHRYINDIKKLTDPLMRFGINFFSHTRIYKDNTFLDISNNLDMINYFYYQSEIYKYYLPDINPWIFNNNFFLCSSLTNNPAINGIRKNLNIDNIIVLFEKFDDHCELYHFGSSVGNDGIIDFYLNNLDLLKCFSLTFDESASNIIKEFFDNPIYRPIEIYENLELIYDYTLSRSKFYRFVKTDGIKINFHQNSIKFSFRELEILKWCIFGKSSFEISIIINISKRTVENHLSNVKNKLECYKIIDVLRILDDLGLTNLIRNL